MGLSLNRTLQRLKEGTEALVSPPLRATWSLRHFGLTKVPLLLYCMPTVRTLDQRVAEVEIPLNWRTRNHYRSMYFGALAVGADCAAGYLAQHVIEHTGGGVQLLFSDFHAVFHRRPEDDVLFTCAEGELIAEMVAEARRTGERVTRPVTVRATVPKRGKEPVATFTLGLSLKQGRAKA